ncbi:MAG: glycerol-3-phosphate 1-O-acyltransferase PlsY [Coriobacteriia bacterium]|nr:glycerol-3-phosphate 1-O-acyltransferase PlsY [Coriobacteriia bacterium]
MDIVVGMWLWLLAAYFLGAIPFALLVGKWLYGTDVRDYGSGNLGATNVYRVLGWGAGMIVFALDVGKGALAVWIASLLHPQSMGPEVHDWVLIGAALAAVVGHSYSPYIRFRGGKSVATAAGALLFITPLAWPILFGTFIVVVAASRMVSLGSIVIAVEFPLLTLWLYGDSTAIVTMSFVTSALVLWRHHRNMRRIVRGEEAKIGLRGRTAGPSRNPAEGRDDEGGAS